ncbi:MAG: V-type ATP synthase subunit E [bacterium]|nr:V-type ATP synthase subunit E [bacterium]MDT8396639.1 V-type ATP synthase subunit E [bacterium]
MNDRSRDTSGSDRLLESLWQDAKREAAQNLSRATAQAAKLLADIQAYRDREVARAHERALEKAAPEIARILNRARGAVEKRTLDETYRFLDECLARARILLNGSEDISGAARAAFEPLFRQAAVHFESEQEVRIVIAPADLEIARRLVSEAGFECTIAEEPGILGGARIEAANGSRLVDNTIAGRLAVLGEYPPVEVLGSMLPGIRSIPDPDAVGEVKG